MIFAAIVDEFAAHTCTFRFTNALLFCILETVARFTSRCTPFRHFCGIQQFKATWW